MKEIKIRKIHRILGVALSIFLGLQAITGLYLSVRNWNNISKKEKVSIPVEHVHAEHDALSPVFESLIGVVHRGGGWYGLAYRMVVGLGIIGLSFSGLVIFFQSRSRLKNH
ncbi:hypothetical protein DBT_0583 [Dissulfuribacter thermophilus]|uniref:Uncharacterized protein n=1 Tax=Dissulfuribacter thermophilus TaxID=1156395 RepID=A0A1B9F8L4_9BACT|nr:hypothetical protein [Dissulfuribacter thermophilus]OCC16121.1 hypothetical protein DBT_0583 [Dissulfuribacter thermophilus]